MKKLTLSDCPVQCLQNEFELQQLLETIEKHNPKKIVEIGTFYGGTLWFFLQAAKNMASFTAVDLPIPDYDDRYQEMIRSRTLWQSWMKDNQEIHNVVGNSHNEEIIASVHRLHPENDIDMLHIDGDHTYAGVKADYENFRNLVKPGGLIVFHDVVGIPDVAQFFNELISDSFEDNLELIEDKSGAQAWGIGIIKVAE